MNRIVGILIKSQQFYLKELGFYDGPIDGLWGLKSRQAMRDFQKDDQYKPALKTDDSPFVPFDRLPQGFKWDVIDGQRGIIKLDNLPYILTTQSLIEGIEGTGARARPQYMVVPIQEKEKPDSIADYI